MKVIRKIIEINEELCDGCGLCVPSCSEGAIQIINGRARLVAEKYCDGLGACLGECPTGALKITERKAEDFDYAAVEEHLNLKSQSQSQAEESQEKASLPCGCPSTQVESFKQTKPGQEAHHPIEPTSTGTESGLSHWPVQIKLVPPSAPFLKGADLLVLADCTAVAYPDLHRDFLPGKVVMMGCPKFDHAEEYIQKFSSIFKVADIRQVTVLMMEVPCCSGLSAIIEQGLVDAGKQVPTEKVIISTRGKIVRTS